MTFYVSLTRDLLHIYLRFEAESHKAVYDYLENEYLEGTVYKLPWCSVYSTLPSDAQTVLAARCGYLYERSNHEIWQETT